MSYLEHFAAELNNTKTQYFILDTKGSGSHGDVDFIQYQWSRSRYNLVSEGDLFVYRRPREASETKEFYFFGAAKIGEISGDNRVAAAILKPYPFKQYLHKRDLETFQWTWKERGRTWEHFFNQYGMNRITKEDFIRLLQVSEGGAEEFDYDPQAATEATQEIQRGNYYVGDKEGKQKIRSKQQVFANQVKSNYQNRCAICSIQTRPFLIGSHIIPWVDRKESRLDPSNGICLCSLHDTAFDKGYLTIDDNNRIVVSNYIQGDPVLKTTLNEWGGKKLHLPKKMPPKTEYLEYHRQFIFEKYRKNPRNEQQ